MKIRKGLKEDLNRIMEIYAYARRFMAEHGNYIDIEDGEWIGDDEYGVEQSM